MLMQLSLKYCFIIHTPFFLIFIVKVKILSPCSL
nr:MAG TPA: hypothetical protein [Caudoviricetes sp.]